MKITRTQLKRLITEVFAGYPDDRAPFDAAAALKRAKEKMTRNPLLVSMLDDDDDYAAKRQAYELSRGLPDLTADEKLAADMASDVIMTPEDPNIHLLYDDDDYDKPKPEELDPDERFYHPKDSMPIEQPLQGIVSKIIPELRISKHDRNPRGSQETTTYHTPDKKYQILMSFRPEYVDEREPQFSEPTQYTVEVRKYNPEYKKYQQARFNYPGSMGSMFFDGTKAFWTSFYHTANFVNVLKDLKNYLKEIGTL